MPLEWLGMPPSRDMLGNSIGVFLNSAAIAEKSGTWIAGFTAAGSAGSENRFDENGLSMNAGSGCWTDSANWLGGGSVLFVCEPLVP